MACFPHMSEVQRERADLGRYAFDRWVRRRSDNAPTPPAGRAANTPSIVPRAKQRRQPQESATRRPLEIRELPRGIKTRPTEVVNIRQTAHGPIQIFPSRAGHESTTKEGMSSMAETESESDESEAREEDDANSEGEDNIPSATLDFASPSNLTGTLLTTQAKENDGYRATRQRDLSWRIEDFLHEVNQALKHSLP